NFDEAVMTDIATLEHELMRTIDAAADEAELEAARVAALGKRGSISALLATLGKMSPDERKQQGPLINGLKDRVTAAVAARHGGRFSRTPRLREGSIRKPSTSRCRRWSPRRISAGSIRSAR